MVPIMARSPRVRGNHVGAAGVVRVDRSIPARTGEPQAYAHNPDAYRVYPRAYGGTGKSKAAKFCSQGLSPRVRGNPSRRGRRRARSGSIPARTGEPLDNGTSQLRFWVYPRAYGGTFTQDDADTYVEGLSPRVRGNPCRAARGSATCRSIPARTGEPPPLTYYWPG